MDHGSQITPLPSHLLRWAFLSFLMMALTELSFLQSFLQILQHLLAELTILKPLTPLDHWAG